MRPMTRVWGNALALCGALVLIAASSAQADTRYAAPGATGPGVSCPQADPCSLQHAVSDTWADDGDSVRLAPGDYDLAGGTAIVIANAIDVAPQDPGTRPRILNHTNPALTVIDDATITGIRAEATGLPNGIAVIHIQGGPRVRLERMIVFSPALPNSQAIGVFNGAVELIDSAVYVAGIDSRGLDFFSQPRDSAIVNSTVLAAGAGSTALSISSPFAGQPAYAVQVRNTIARGTGSGIETSDLSVGDDVDVTVDFTHSNLSAVGDAAGDDAVVNLGTGMQSQPPLLADPAAGDFAQLAGSPTIDAGLADPFSGPLDLMGGPRIAGAAIDIGADEYPSPVTEPADAVPPETTITKGPKRKQKASKRRAKAKFEFASSESGSSFACKLDKAEWKPCASPYVTKVKAKFKAKKHVLLVRATDAAGNTDPSPTAHRWKLKRKR